MHSTYGHGNIESFDPYSHLDLKAVGTLLEMSLEAVRLIIAL
jgi:hypothetical protein